MNGIIIFGTSSYAGKSLLVTALCRILANQGIKVTPFKAQNMSLNSWVTKEGGEIGISQAVQAKAAGIKPTTDMNPILLKPKGEGISQVIVKGKPYTDKKPGDYHKLYPKLRSWVLSSFRRLVDEYQVILVEGAGGAAEINLYDRDIVNLGMARTTGFPIILIGDIDRGGVFASLYGTTKLLPPDVKAKLKGFVINKFRGDKNLLTSGLNKLEDLTGIPTMGIIPHSEVNIPSEDSLSLSDKDRDNEDKDIEIAVIKLPHISNFTDFESLESESRVRVKYVDLKENIGAPDVIILPGTKNTVDDLLTLKQAGMGKQIDQFKGPIIGVCGGFQMLGKEIIDCGMESVSKETRTIPGLGLLNVITKFESYKKRANQVKRTVAGGGPILGPIKGQKLKGYEIHMGTTKGNHHRVFEEEGYIKEDGLVFGTYMHGLFWNQNFRSALLDYLFTSRKLTPPSLASNQKTNNSYQDWARIVKESLNMDIIYHLLGFD